MKKLGMLVLGWVLVGGLYQPSAYAGVADWPGVSQVVKVGTCLLADAGKITQSLATHVAGFAVETLTTVRDCLNYTVDVITPGTDENPHPHEEPVV